MLADAFLRSGKVRDLYELPNRRIALVASDRISAFDVVLPTAILDKGRVLTGLSRFWFAQTAAIVPNHLLTVGTDVLDDSLRGNLRGRLMICRPAEVVPVEAVVRGYLAGSAWKEYRDHGSVCGIDLPAGLHESDRLPEPIFTPATKAEQGEHDQNISFDGMIEHLESNWLPTAAARPIAEQIRAQSIRLYQYAAAVTERGGIILADTKFEFGRPLGLEGDTEDEGLILIDEVLTPDSSRLWDAESYEPGRPQASFDKQFVRDWLETQPWDKTAPGPALPDDVADGTRARYVGAYERITGASFERYLQEDIIAP